MPHGSLPWQTMFEAVGTTACGALELAPPPRDGAFHDAVLLTFQEPASGHIHATKLTLRLGEFSFCQDTTQDRPR